MTKRISTKGQTTIYKHTYKTKDRITRTPLKTGSELRCSERVSSSCYTSGTRRVNLVTNPVINRDNQVMVTIVKLKHLPRGKLGSVDTMQPIIEEIHTDRNPKLWNIVYTPCADVVVM